MAEGAQKRTRAAPQAGPRTTLLDLWRGDLSEVVAAFLPLESIATVPRFSRRFRMLWKLLAPLMGISSTSSDGA